MTDIAKETIPDLARRLAAAKLNPYAGCAVTAALADCQRLAGVILAVERILAGYLHADECSWWVPMACGAGPLQMCRWVACRCITHNPEYAHPCSCFKGRMLAALKGEA